MAFSVRPVTAENLDAVLKLSVAPGQRRFVATVERSLAQVSYEPAGWPMAIYSGEDPAGFMLLYDARKDKDKPAAQLYVWRLMVDARFQRLGLGRQAMRWVLAEARRLGLEEVGLSHVMAPGHAGPFYEKMGFAYTGEIDDGEHKMLLRLEGTAA
ncbi:MAG TPA: GNAT family N-acetyltransferase [Rubrivivax sp.]|nr:GNAT family N-acetyltransferase [Rubrivivax sp.]